MITLQEKECVKVSYQDSLIKLAKIITLQERVCKDQLSRQPDDSWQK
jgi:hypothetical protein